MEFGIFSNARRPNRALSDAWDRDIDEIVVADKLGFNVAWISEHQSPAELIICKAAGRTSRIRLGSAVRPVAYYHPLQVVIEANACDQLTHGRYQLGVGFGFYRTQMEQRGLDFDKTREMIHTSIELILKLWNSKEPVDHDGPFWIGKGMVAKPDCVQKPHPPIGIALSRSPSSAEMAGKFGLLPLTGDFIPVPRLKMLGDTFVAAQRANGRPQRKDLRAARALLAAIDAGPFSQVVDVGVALLEERFLQPLERVGVGGVALRVLRAEAHLDAGFLEEAFVARDIDRQVEDRVVRRDAYDWAHENSVLSTQLFCSIPPRNGS